MLHPLEVVSAVLHRVHAWLTTLLLFVLSLGPIPNHVGFVMDGNRRYARGKGMQVSQGHTDGFTSLRRVLEVCLRLRIPVVTIYAFAIDNFSRDATEVDALMDLAKTRLAELCRHGQVQLLLRGCVRVDDFRDLLQKYGVRIRFVGRREMFRPDVLSAVENMERLTASNTRGLLNVCSPYASRDEIVRAMTQSISDHRAGQTRPISDETVFSQLETCRNISKLPELDCGKLDILVRTSDVKRLSDFMMWQASEDTQLHFVKTHWPEFGLTDMLPILLGWQQKKWLQAVGC